MPLATYVNVLSLENLIMSYFCPNNRYECVTVTQM